MTSRQNLARSGAVRTRPPQSGRRQPSRRVLLVQHATQRLIRLLTRHSIDILRVNLGLVFLGFGALKFVPGASPAQELAERTLEKLSLGIVSGETALLVTALAECFIGVTLITGKLLRAGLIVLAASMVGILSPLVLFFHDLFPGAPTLEGQYVLKDFVLVAAGLVIAAQAATRSRPGSSGSAGTTNTTASDAE